VSRTRRRGVTLNDPHFASRGVFVRTLTARDRSLPALPVPIAERFRAAARDAGYPELGEGNGLLDDANAD
jgi:hypothetical protein